MEPTDTLVERLLREAMGGKSANTQVVRVEGMGSMWNGIAIGIALGTSIACAGWVAATMGDIRDEQRQTSAFMSSIFQHVPELRAIFLKESQGVEHPDSQPAAPASTPAAGHADQSSEQPTADRPSEERSGN